MIKKLLLSIGLVVGFTCFNASGIDAMYSTNWNNGLHTGGAFTLISNDVIVTEIQLSSSTDPTTIRFFDNAGTAGLTNYQYGTNVSVGSYPTNIVTTYVSTTGITNTFTNVGIFTYYLTNAPGSNTLPALFTYSLPASTASPLIHVALPFSKGLSIYSTGSNITATVWTRPLF